MTNKHLILAGLLALSVLGNPPAALADSDGDGYSAPADCDDADPLVFPGQLESCNGVDDDCSGDVEASNVVPFGSPLPNGPASNVARGAILEATRTEFLDTISMGLDAPVGSVVTWALLESESATGTYRRIAEHQTVITVAGFTKHDSRSFRRQLTAGRFYAAVSYWAAPTTWAVVSPTPSYPVSGDFGDLLGGVQISGPVPTSISLAPAPLDPTWVEFKTFGEHDDDGDGALACAPDCPDDDPGFRPDAAEICDGLDNDCDGVAAFGGLCPDAVGSTTYQPSDTGFRGNHYDMYDGAVLTDFVQHLMASAGTIVTLRVYEWDVAALPGPAGWWVPVYARSTVLPAWTPSVEFNDIGFEFVETPDNDFGQYLIGIDVGPNQTVSWDMESGTVDQLTACTQRSYGDNITEPLGGDALDPLLSMAWQHRAVQELTLGWLSEQDSDGDGAPACDDCDDADPTVFPGAPELCDGLDNDCDPGTDETIDGDGDGQTACGSPSDCLEGDPNTWTGAPELCDGLDNDCDGTVPAPETDPDADGYVGCSPWSGSDPLIFGGDDCDELKPFIYPGAPERCDGVDDDCDGVAPPDETDDDTVGGPPLPDGWVECAPWEGADPAISGGGDCDDVDGSINPGAAELCNGADEDCDGFWDFGFASYEEYCDPIDPLYFADTLQGFGGNHFLVERPVLLQEVQQRVEVAGGTDYWVEVYRMVWNPAAGQFDYTWEGGVNVIDSPPTLWISSGPLNIELQPGEYYTIGVRTEDPAVFYGQGGAATQQTDFGMIRYFSVQDVLAPWPDPVTGATAGYGFYEWFHQGLEFKLLQEYDNDGDGFLTCEECDDANVAVYPGAPELCDGLDNDCNGLPDADPAGEVDADGDGSLSCDDCDDANASNFPGNAEVCDGLDNDCNSLADFDPAGEADVDADNWLSCEDCDDADTAVNPDAVEACNAVDDDCDGLVDDGFDADGDGVTTCGADGAASTADDDCNDADASVHPGAIEFCDEVDSDCDGSYADEFPDLDGDDQPDCVDVDKDGDGQNALVDCNDEDPTIYPGAPESCDWLDSDCDGSLVDEFPNDDDPDGYPDEFPDCIDPAVPWEAAPGSNYMFATLLDPSGAAITDPCSVQALSDGAPVATGSVEGDLVVVPIAPTEPDTWVLEVACDDHTEAWRHIRVEPGHDVATQPMIATELHQAWPIGPGGGTADSDDGLYSVFIPPGALPADAQVRVTTLETREQLGNHLPSTSAFTYAVHLSAEDAVTGEEITTFAAPVTVTVQEYRGINEAIPVGHYDEETHRWVHLALAECESETNCDTVSFETEHFSFFDINSPSEGPPGDAIEDASTAEEEDVNCGNSTVALYDQTLGEQIATPTMNVFDGPWGVSFSYSSKRVRPDLLVRVPIKTNYPYGAPADPPNQVSFWAQFEGQSKGLVYDFNPTYAEGSPEMTASSFTGVNDDDIMLKAWFPAVSGSEVMTVDSMLDPGDPALLAEWVDWLESGFYRYDFQIGYQTADAEYGSSLLFAGLSEESTTVSVGPEMTSFISGGDRVLIVNGRDSPYGRGWALDGHRELYFDIVENDPADPSDDELLAIGMAEGGGDIHYFDPGHAARIAGTGSDDFDVSSLTGDAQEADLKAPRGLAVNASGDLFIADMDWHCILQVEPGGDVSVFAGACGTPASSPSTGPSSSSPLNAPTKIEVRPGTNDVYFVESAHHCVRRLVETSPGNFDLETAAGDCGVDPTAPAYAEGSVSATSIALDPAAIAFDPSGATLYVLEGGDGYVARVLAVDLATGDAATVVGRADDYDGPDELPHRRTLDITTPIDLAYLGGGDCGRLLVGEANAEWVDNGIGIIWEAELSDDGTCDDQWTHFAGNAEPWGPSMGGMATTSPLGGLSGFTATPAGHTYVALQNRVIHVSPEGVSQDLLGTGLLGYRGASGPSRSTTIGKASDVAIAPDGAIYAATAPYGAETGGWTFPSFYSSNRLIWRVDPDVWWSIGAEGGVRLSAIDPDCSGWTLLPGKGVKECFEAPDPTGAPWEFRHEWVRDAVGNETSFSYNADGLVDEIVLTAADASFSLATQIEYPGSQVRVTDAAGRLTVLTLDGGELTQVEMPEEPGPWTFDYEGGLLTHKTDPFGGSTEYVWDLDKGRVESVIKAGPTDLATEWFSSWDDGLAGDDSALFYGPQPAWLASDEEVVVERPGASDMTYYFHSSGRVSHSVVEDAYTDPVTGALEDTETWFSQDRATGVNRVTTSSGSQTRLYVDSRGRVSRTHHVDTGLWSYQEYNDQDQVTRWIGPPFVDAVANQFEAFDPDSWPGHEVVSVYDDDADPTWQLLSTEHVIDKDEDGNPTVSDLTAYTYETNGQIDTVQDPMGRTWSYDYGTYGNLAAVYEPGIVNPATILHDSFGNAETVADQEGRQVITYYDQQNRPTSVIRVTEDDWETRTIDYDLVPADGCPDVRCTRITDELGGQFWFAFDELGRLTSTEDATEGIEAYQYNGEGQLQQYTDRSGSYTTFSYDSAGRLDGRSVFDPGDNLEASYSTGYDADGNVISLVEEDAVGAPVRELTWTYDAAGRVTTASATGDELVDWSFTYDYNNRGQLDLRTGAGDALDYQYDAERFQVDKTELDSNSSHAVNLSWDITGRLDEAWTSNDLHNDFAWTPAGHLDSILHRKLSTSATPFRTLEYDTDSSGAIIALDDDGEGPLGFDLDDAWRLEDIGPPESAPVLSYWYDAIGNRITGDDDDSAGDDDDSASEYEYDASHRMYESPDASFLFDETGNVVQRIDKLTGQVHDYVWNAQGQLESVEVYDVGDVLLLTADFVYDPIGRRVATYVANYVTGFVEDDFFVYEGGHIESTYTAEDDPSSQTARYLYGPAVDMPLARVEPDGDYFGYLLDASGTVREVRDSANVNAVAASYVLDPWGNAIDIDESGLEQPFRFHGRPFVDLDPTSGEFPLYDFRARWYDPVSGRFLSEDPLWPFEPHPYAFADNNPIQFGDPSGQCVKGRLAVGALGAIAVGVTDAAATVIKSLDSLNDWVALNKCMSGGEAYQAWANDNLAMTQNGLRNAVTAAVFGGVGGPGCGRSEFKATKVCRCRCGNSVAEGTLVDTAEGLRPIETLEPGDLVWTRRDDPLNPGEFLAPVAGVWRGQGAEIVRVMVGGDELLLTPDHPVWTEANGWVHADALGPDDSLVMAGGLPVRVTAVAPESGAVPVYNLAVEEGETFFVGESRTWVHNCPPGVAAAIARHGGREVDGGYMFPNRRAARAAASEVAGDLGSTPATTRKSDFRGGPWSWRDSPGVIGKQNQPGKASSRGWRDDPIGHPRHDMGPHVNVWNDGWGSHFFYPGGG